MEPEHYMPQAESFCRSVNLEHYLAGAGLQARLNIAPIYDRHVALFEGERFEETRHWGLEPTEERYLREFIASGNLRYKTRALAEEYAAAESAAIVEWDERPLPYREAPGRIANEADPVRRHELERRHLAVMASLNAPLEAREKSRQREARGFGFPDYVAAYDDLRALNLQWLTEQFERLISTTDELYFSALDTYLSEMNILRDDARRCDLARIFRATHLDGDFQTERMLPTLHATIRDLGMILEDQSNIHLDIEARPLKSPRAFCSTIGVPDDVRLVLKPSGGVQDFETLLHEAGHAEHYGNVDPSLQFAYRWAGDSSVTESYAFLVEYLMHDRLWLRRHLGIDQPKHFLHLAGFHKLYFLRRYGTKLKYEAELHRADEPNDVAPLYDELFTRNLGVGYGQEAYLSDVDEGFYAAQYLRAWIFEAQHRAYLRREFGDEWFRNRKAGSFLVELWHDGQRNPVDQLARFMGYEGLDLGPVTEEIHDLMGTR